MLSRDTEGKWIISGPDGVTIQVTDETKARDTQRGIEFVAKVRDVATRLLDVHREILMLDDLRDVLDLESSNVVTSDVTRSLGMSPAQFWSALQVMVNQAKAQKADRSLLVRLARSASSPLQVRFG